MSERHINVVETVVMVNPEKKVAEGVPSSYEKLWCGCRLGKSLSAEGEKDGREKVLC